MIKNNSFWFPFEGGVEKFGGFNENVEVVTMQPKTFDKINQTVVCMSSFLYFKLSTVVGTQVSKPVPNSKDSVDYFLSLPPP